jgi:Uma2 family endonuclease
MTAQPKPRRLTEAEYLSIEREAEVRSEFYAGEMFAMAGGSPAHNTIKENLVGELHGRLKGGPCRSFSSDQRVKVAPTGPYTYPDILLVCGPVQYDPADGNTLTNPQVLIEVLSPGTAEYDRGTKFRHYQKLESVQEIVLVSQDRPKLERFVRQSDDTWVLATFDDPAGSFSLATVPVTIPLTDVYRDVTFPENPPLR